MIGIISIKNSFLIHLHVTCAIILREHAAVTLLPREELVSLDWAEADRPVLKTYLQFAGQETP